MQKKSVLMGDKTVYYMECGEMDAPVVLFLHGFPESSLLWETAATFVQNLGYRAIAPDLPGFGQSEPFQEPATWERYMQFLNDFTDQLSLKTFHLITHDWGVLIGVRWACENSNRVLSLVVSDATFSPDFKWHKEAMIIRTPNKGEQWVEYLQNKEVFEGFMKKSVPSVSSEIIEDFFELFSDSSKGNITLDLYRSGEMHKLEIYRGRLAEFLSMPVTIIFGENDTFINPKYGLSLKNEELNHASYYVIPGVGHFTPLEAESDFHLLLKQHLKQLN